MGLVRAGHGYTVHGHGADGRARTYCASDDAPGMRRSKPVDPRQGALSFGLGFEAIDPDGAGARAREQRKGRYADVRLPHVRRIEDARALRRMRPDPAGNEDRSMTHRELRTGASAVVLVIMAGADPVVSAFLVAGFVVLLAAHLTTPKQRDRGRLGEPGFGPVSRRWRAGTDEPANRHLSRSNMT